MMICGNVHSDGDGEVDSGEFLMAMLVAEDICSEDVCKAYLEKCVQCVRYVCVRASHSCTNWYVRLYVYL